MHVVFAMEDVHAYVKHISCETDIPIYHVNGIIAQSWAQIIHYIFHNMNFILVNRIGYNIISMKT